jgi:catechol 2,3-dioxygenase-like lactoylglutathione lyase family enzyme
LAHDATARRVGATGDAMGLSLRFLYLPCRDLEDMRRFYTDLVGLPEVFYAPGAGGGLAYLCDRLQLTFFPAPDAAASAAGWHRQPGWKGGTVPGASWSIVAGDEAAFRAAVARLTEAAVPRRAERPRWVGYWSFPVQDPMGNTVEITLPVEGEGRSNDGA